MKRIGSVERREDMWKVEQVLGHKGYTGSDKARKEL